MISLLFPSHSIFQALKKMSEQKSNVMIDSEKELSVSYSHEDQVDVLENIDPQLEARIRRKLDMRVVPMATLIYLMAFIDRYITHETCHSVRCEPN